MTVFNIGKLPFGSYKGVDFHFQESSITGGRKTISHEYPDSNERYVEDLGLLQKSFSISAFVDTNISFADRDALIKVLEEAGIGTLIHPLYGEQDVVVISYTLNDNINSLGFTKFDISFQRAEKNKLPTSTKGNKGFLASLKSKILGKNEDAFNSAFKTVTDAKAKLDSANQTVKKVMRKVQNFTRVAQGSVDTIGDLTTTINEIVNTSVALVKTPSVLATKLRMVFDNMAVAYNNSSDVVKVVQKLFGFDERDRVAIGSSQVSKDIRTNQDQINNFINASALALAYDAAANIDYKNLDELNNVNDILENGFNAMPTNLDRAIYNSLIEMRIEANNLLSNLAIGLPKIVNFEAKNISLNYLVYQLYGSLDLKNTIRDLNQLRDTSRINGTIKILSNE